MEELNKLFIKEYGGEGNDVINFFSPGRVNLIGEHIDYNGGFVFPAALTIGIYGALRYRKDNIVKLRSKNSSKEILVDLDREINYDEEDGWGNYPKGVIKYLLSEGYKLCGCEIYFVSTLPESSGLSSSAALEVLTAYMMLYGTLKDNVDRVYLSKLTQKVENEFVKVNCGIMDQFSVAMGKKDNAILLDCSTLKYEYVPFKLSGYSLVIMNSNKKRGLADSKYNERRSECDRALEIINRHKTVNTLCEAVLEDIDKYLEDDILIRRTRHVVTENQRVLKAVEVLKKGDIKEFGRLLNASHASLKDDYEVSGFELDSLVEGAQRAEGCLGARMTGAGFGGCAIAIVKNENLDEFKNFTMKYYKDKTGITTDFYTSEIGDGVKKL
jgi:galactokinase